MFFFVELLFHIIDHYHSIILIFNELYVVFFIKRIILPFLIVSSLIKINKYYNLDIQNQIQIKTLNYIVFSKLVI